MKCGVSFLGCEPDVRMSKQEMKRENAMRTLYPPGHIGTDMTSAATVVLGTDAIGASVTGES